MATGISVPITSDTKAFNQGVKTGVIDPLEDVEDILKDVAKAGDKTGDTLVDGMRDAQKATERNEKANKELADAIKKTGRAGKDAGNDIDDGARKAEKSFDKIGEEAQGTAQEVTASFDGSADSIAGGFQELAAKAFSGFGPAGVIAGAAAATGIGLVTQELQRQQEENEKLKSAMSSLYADAAEAGRAFLSEDQIIAETHRLMWEDDGKTFAQIKEDAATIGVSWQTFIAARAGDEDALAQAVEGGNQKYQERLDKMNINNTYGATQVAAVDDEASAIDDVVSKLEVQSKLMQTNKQTAADELSLKQKSAEAEERQNAASAARYDRSKTPIVLQPTVDMKSVDQALAKKRYITVGVKDQYGRLYQ